MTDDHQRILALFESSCAAWNRGDIDGYLAGYWRSDKVRWVSEGIVQYGFDAIASACKARFSSPDNMGRLEVANLEVQLLGEATHWYLARGRKLHVWQVIMVYSPYTRKRLMVNG